MPKNCFRREDIRKLEYQQLIRPVLAVDEAGAHDVARRLKQHLTAVMSFAIENGIIKSNPPAGIKPRFTVVKTRHHPALPESRIQELLLRISNYNSEKMNSPGFPGRFRAS